MDKHLNLSVHQLVDFLLRKGDIDNRIYNQDAMTEGTRIHALYQSKQGENYISEHYLLGFFDIDGVQIKLDGRADGIIKQGDNKYIIDEIKSTLDDLSNFHNEQEEWHLGQAKCYALMYCNEIGLEDISVRLTYISQIDNSKRIFNYHYTRQELDDYVHDLLNQYLVFFWDLERLKENRNKSIEELKFPYTNFRPNQKRLSKYIFSINKQRGNLYVEAPTGIGKTISTLYPSIKSLTLGENEKIFYLTAKNSGKLSALKAITDMKGIGLKLLDIVITAKEKICFCKGASCNPDECPFAKGYYSKIKSVIEESIRDYDTFDQKTIENIAANANICPFEFQLDLSLVCDVIICDYNYMFDPISHMQRYFDEDCSHYIALIDEAHNLVERGKSMYSAALFSKNFKQLKKELRGIDAKKLKRELTKTIKFFDEYEMLVMEKDREKLSYFDDDFIYRLEALLQALRDEDKNNHQIVTETFKDLSMDINRFLNIYEFFDDSYLCYIAKVDEGVSINLSCLDASDKIRKTLKTIHSSTLFSATLSPYDYYLTLLGGNINTDPLLTLPSPFEKEKLKTIVVPNISTKYKRRDSTYQKVAEYIEAFVSSKIGNYLVYLPSYEYLNKVLEYIDLKDADVIIQEKDMTDIDKDNFIDNFLPNPTRTTVGFVIVGGSFGEGIDLVNDRLIGVVVVGVGLPQICFEKDEERKYFDSKELDGYNYAYVYPGINRVYQAIGRIIRTEDDKGIALLIDDRYLSKPYLDMFENKLSNYEVALNKDEIIEIINEFWSN